MSASLFDLLKYAQTGVASPSMTFYDKMRASVLMGGGMVETLTGIPPLTLEKSAGKPLKSWSMIGNIAQDGVPTPDNPVDVKMVGDRTDNLFDATKSVQGIIDNNGNITSNFAYSTSEFIRIDADFTISLLSVYTPSSRLIKCGYYTESKQHIANADSTAFRDGYKVLPFTPPDGTAYIRFSFVTRDGYEDSNIMLNLGSTALPYEPYGYRIPFVARGKNLCPPFETYMDGYIVVNGTIGKQDADLKEVYTDFIEVNPYQTPTTTPIYLPTPLASGEVLRSDGTRDVKWGKETINITKIITLSNGNVGGVHNLKAVNSAINRSEAFCEIAINSTSNAEGTFYVNTGTAVFVGNSTDTIDTLKEKYNGYTFYYQLATPTTENVSVPQIPTLKGTTILDVDTELKPSEMTIVYRN